MKTKHLVNADFVGWFLIGLIFMILFVMPMVFTRIDGEISWKFVVKIWKDLFLLLPLFAVNHWLLVPKLLLRKNYISYFLAIWGLILFFSSIYYYQDEILNKKPKKKFDIENKRPDPIPPYANLLMYSLFIVCVDSGFSFLKKWHETEEKKHLLEKENAEMQLDILRNQISPHFFMNTLNNIYALIDSNTQTAKEAVMKLSKLMRYMLYENVNGKVKLSKEFEFVRSYIALMKLRFDNTITIQLDIPENFDDVWIPPMLYIAYIENAFKYGTSYQNSCFINIIFEVYENRLYFRCINTIYVDRNRIKDGGLGLKNNENRLQLLYNDKYVLAITTNEKLYNVSLSIPIS